MPISLIFNDKPTTWEPDPDPHGFIRHDSSTQFPILPSLGGTAKKTSAAKNVVVSDKDVSKSHEPVNTSNADDDICVTQDQKIADIHKNKVLTALIAMTDLADISYDINDSNITPQDDVFSTEDNTNPDHNDHRGGRTASKNRSEVGSEEFSNLSKRAEALISQTRKLRNDNLFIIKQRLEEIETIRNQLNTDDVCMYDNLLSMASNIVSSIREASEIISSEALDIILGDISNLDTQITDHLRDLFPRKMAESDQHPKDADPTQKAKVVDPNQQTKVDQINERLRAFTIHKKECNENKKKNQEKLDKLDAEIATIKEHMERQDQTISNHAKCIKGQDEKIADMDRRQLQKEIEEREWRQRMERKQDEQTKLIQGD